MDLLQHLGKVALGSRLRRLGDTFAADATRLYSLYDVNIQAKWFPVFYLLSQKEENSITSMAKKIGCSHPMVSQVVKEMSRAGLVETGKSEEDARINVVRLTEAGQAILPSLEAQMEDVSTAVEALMKEMRQDFWRAVEVMELRLGEKSLYERVAELHEQRASEEITIIDYQPQYHEDFRQLNIQWISKHFEMEGVDFEALDYPQETILSPGGAILLAKKGNAVVGTCALLKHDAETYELLKMTVAPEARGNHIGWMLGCAALGKAREVGATNVFLESNTKLKAAINLYKKLGFKRVELVPSPFKRCNVRMELALEEGRKNE